MDAGNTSVICESENQRPQYKRPLTPEILSSTRTRVCNTRVTKLRDTSPVPESLCSTVRDHIKIQEMPTIQKTTYTEYKVQVVTPSEDHSYRLEEMSRRPTTEKHCILYQYTTRNVPLLLHTGIYPSFYLRLFATTVVFFLSPSSSFAF